MHCPRCDGDLVGFAVPEDLRDRAESDQMTVCTRCLRTAPADEVGVDPDAVQSADDADFSAVHADFPAGRGGVTFALGLGKLGSLALERAAIESLFEAAERAGVDVWLTLDRLAVAGALDPHFDVERRTDQLRSFE